MSDTATGTSEVLLPYGLDAQGKLRAVAEVPRGLACRCTCPGCGQRLIARKGTQVVHHFGHDGGHCGRLGLESALHLLAKEALLRHRRIRLPGATATDGEDWEEVEAAGVVLAVTIETERARYDFRPDAIITRTRRFGGAECAWGGGEVLVEFRVTHRVDEAKAAKVRSAGAAMVEVDLSAFDWSGGRAEHEFRILGLDEGTEPSVTRQWIHHPVAAARSQAMVREAAARKRRAEVDRRERERRRLERRRAEMEAARATSPIWQRPDTPARRNLSRKEQDEYWERYVRLCHDRAVADALALARRTFGDGAEEAVARAVEAGVARSGARFRRLGLLSTYESYFLCCGAGKAVKEGPKPPWRGVTRSTIPVA